MSLNTITNQEQYPSLGTSLFINNFQGGASQSPNLGIGAIVGMDAYSKPGAIILGKGITNTFSSFGSLGEYPTYVDFSGNQSGFFAQRVWVQTAIGTIYYSDNYGVTTPTWTQVVVASAPVGSGNGLICFQDGGNPYVFIFFDTQIWYAQSNLASYTSSSFIQWKTGLVGLSTSPIANNHFPYLFPNQHGIYFANANQVGFFGAVYPIGATAPTAFNPAGTINTDYQYSGSLFSLPSNYSINTLDFLSPSSLAIGANNVQSGQEADIFTWDTISANKFSAPIKIFSGVNVNGTQGVKQLVNRQNILYAAVGGNHAFYSTNGATLNIIADFSQYSVVRDGLYATNGAEYPVPVFYNSFPSAVAVSGNRILTGTGTSVNNSYFPASNVGVFPTGVWSVYFNNDGSTLEQMDYVIPFNPSANIGAVSSFSTTGDYAAITVVKPLPTGQLLVGWVTKFGAGAGIGNITIFDSVKYITDLTLTSLESPMYEIGSALNPEVPGTIEINLVKTLLAGQQIEVSYRTSNDKDWSVIATFAGDGTTNAYAIDEHGIGLTRYLQIRIRMCTGSPNLNSTPELRNIIINS